MEMCLEKGLTQKPIFLERKKNLPFRLNFAIQGVPLTFFTFQKPRTQNVLTLDPELVKPNCV